ncbi:helix-turn-helix transcriptional regulator [Rhabdothermincola salaria]|uniref:helix-turn-helix transcriptional regulator n=1 Tax=Rhabdothermincola salaria TaxID=2903142 RepID=UPI001E59AE9A|nr:helix-turn-helix transcriptional regulator [Rhabdothermincola salaria]MCD9622388.1 helix-turn-helix transcriptional regulator [Rhabdothermincola salaria]
MGSALTLRRVKSDIEVLARAGLDTSTFLAEADASLQRAVPHVAACIPILDPATNLLTGTYKFGDLFGRDDHDDEWGTIEFGGSDPTSFAELLRREQPAVGVHLATNGDVACSDRLRDLIIPHYGYADEARLLACEGARAWGAMALFRGAEEGPFAAEEVAFLATLSDALAAGMRAGLLARAGRTPSASLSGPAVLIVGADGQYRQLSVGAEEALAELGSEEHSAAASGTIAALVAGARRYAAGSTTVLPRCRVRVGSGRWLVLHASPLASLDGTSGDVVVTVEEARPPEIVPLVVAAFELTPRERDVTQMVLQGVETKEIAATLHMSPYTVQDHLKSVFEKAAVRSRRELIARVFFDQYVPRMGSELAPSGWFAEP